MKKTLFSISLLVCLLGPYCFTCYGKLNYTVQILASKTPSDIKWVSAKFHIQEKITEIRGDGWYRYVIGRFENESDAINYITNNLQSKGLMHPFPRVLPDSLQLTETKEIGQINAVVPNIRASIDTSGENQTPVDINVLSKTDSLKKDRNDQTLEKQRRFEKYNPWSELIGWKNLQHIEISIINGAKPFLPDYLLPFYIRMIDSAIRFPIILFFLLLIILFFLNAVGVMIILEISNTLKNRKGRFDQLYRGMYEKALTGYIFQEYSLELAVQRIKNINRPRNRKILVAVLFNFKKNISGDLDQKVIDIFFRLGLHKDAIKKTKSKSFYDQITGLSELTNLYPDGAFSIVEQHINDKSNELRAEAQTSYVRLNHTEPFKFLRTLTKPFTQWTQLTSFYIFKLHKLPEPSFVDYLQSDLYNVRNFSLRMITHFQQMENSQEIIKLLDAERERTRYLAIKAIHELRIYEAKPLLKNAYEKETDKNKLEIVKALLQMGNEEDLGFLENIIRQKDVSLKIEACRSMYFMNSAGMEYLLQLEHEKELNIGPYIAHIYDQRN